MIFNKIYYVLILFSLFSIDIFGQQFFNYTDTKGILTEEKTDFVSRVTGTNTLGQIFISIDSPLDNLDDKGQLNFTNPLSGDELQASPFRVNYQNENNYTWTGKLDDKGGLLTIIRNQAGSIGMLKQAKKSYFIHPITSEVSLFVEINEEEYQDIQCATENNVLNFSFNTLSNEECNLAGDCNRIIDVLVIFTPDYIIEDYNHN